MACPSQYPKSHDAVVRKLLEIDGHLPTSYLDLRMPHVQEVNDELRTRAKMLTSKRVHNLDVYLFTAFTPPQRLNPRALRETF